MPTLARRALAEFFGTFILLVAGTGAIIVDKATGVVTHLGVALTFGLVVLALIYTLGDLSGAHINPAVTLGFVFAARFPIRDAAGYIGAQCLGALAASSFLAVLFPDDALLGGTYPLGPPWRSFTLEVFLTWFLMLAVLNVATGAREKGVMAGVAIGSVIALEALFAGPISGASMNPARSLGPAIAAGKFADLWIYMTAPILGAILAVPTFAAIKHPRC